MALSLHAVISCATLVLAYSIRTPTKANSLLQSGSKGFPQSGSQFRRNVFNKIYQTGYWKDGNKENHGAGGGEWSLKIEDKLCDVIVSTAHKYTANISKTDPIRLLDAPSGDWHWMKLCLPKLAANFRDRKIIYQGLDIADEVVDKLNKDEDGMVKTVTGGSSNLEIKPFLQGDLADEKVVGDVLKGEHYGIILCAHALMHQSLNDASKILNTFDKVPGAMYFITNNYHKFFGQEITKNFDIPTGLMRSLDLHKQPFFLKEKMVSSIPVPTREQEEFFEVYAMPLTTSGV